MEAAKRIGIDPGMEKYVPQTNDEMRRSADESWRALPRDKKEESIRQRIQDWTPKGAPNEILDALHKHLPLRSE